MKNAVPGRPWDHVARCVGEVLYSRGLVAWVLWRLQMAVGVASELRADAHGL